MDKQTTIAFIIIGAILVLWLYLNSPTPVEHKGKPVDTTQTLNDTLNKVTAKKIPEKKSEKTTTRLNASAKDTTQAGFGKYFTFPPQKERLITIDNKLVKLELSTKGGAIKKYYLKKYKNWYSADTKGNKNFYKTHVQLVNYPEGGGGPNLSFVSSDGKAINTAELYFSTNANKALYKLTGNDSLVIRFRLSVDSNKYIEKDYTFYGDKYSMNYKLKLVGMNNLISNNDIDVVWHKGMRFVEENSVDEARYSNASVFYGGDHVIVSAGKNGEKVEKEFSGRVDWIGTRDKYFAFIMAPRNPSGVDGAYIEGTKTAYMNHGERAYYNISLIVPFNNAQVEQKDFTIYIGPVNYDVLKAYGHNFQQMVDFGGIFKFMVRPIAVYILLPLFTFLHSFIPNFGWVLIVFSLIIKFALYPFTKSSYQSMKKMQLLQPKMKEIKEKYKDDPQKMNKETMKLYSTYGVNPAGGCLPLILQMPIFIALWELLEVAIELRQQPFIWWIKDLSRPDIIYTLPFKIPFFGINQISGLALLMGITTFFQQKMTVTDPKQKSLVYIMPIFLTLIFMNFPSGLNLYYFMFNVFSIAQQYYINHKHDGMELKPVKNANRKKGFMTRMMEAAEQNAKTQQKRRR